MNCCGQKRRERAQPRPVPPRPAGRDPSSDGPTRSPHDPRTSAALLAFLARNTGARKP